MTLCEHVAFDVPSRAVQATLVNGFWPLGIHCGSRDKDFQITEIEILVEVRSEHMRPVRETQK